MNWQERIYLGELTETLQNKQVTLYGWIDTIRDHGGVLFSHLRDRTGIVQAVFHPDMGAEMFTSAEKLRSEYVVELKGKLLKRTEENINPNIQNGNIEIQVEELNILNTAETPPFLVSEKDLSESKEGHYVDEDIRLKYRYLDLRRTHMQKNIIGRAKLTQAIRAYLFEKGFLDIETPTLTKSTPEGARDYLVPSRVHESKFYALPQSPQLFKQLLMMSGFDKYYQIVKCFRDEDLRPNRQPEFTQMDLEASFIDEEFIYTLIEGLIQAVYKTIEIDIPTPFKRMTYKDAIETYGSDKPDLRFDMKMVDVTDCFKSCGFGIFKSIVEKGGLIKGMLIPGKAEEMSKNYIQNELIGKVIPKLGGKGMAWMKHLNGKLESNIVQFFSEDEQSDIKAKLNAKDGDLLVFIGDTNHNLVNEVLGKFRLYIAEAKNLIPKDKIATCWVTDFPLFEEKDGHLSSMHHPFTQPSEPIEDINDKEKLLTLTARAYDLAINGEEVGGGSIRIHDTDQQEKIFQILGLSDEEIEAKFGFFTRALKYGTPPHGGIALGIDRLATLLLGTESIREVIAFPKNRTAYCPLTDAPSAVDQTQLSELNLKTR